MSLHKLTAGDGYTYLTRQVAACDATHRGRDGLSDYYTEKGESPGVWLGHGADGLSQFLAATETMTAASVGAPGASAASPAGAVSGAAGPSARATGTRLAGRQVSETQMLALFGEGRHPDADAIEKHLIAEGHSAPVVLKATRLGSPYKLVNGPGAFRIELARRFEQANADAGLPRDWPIPETERAAIRTALGREMFTAQYGRAPTGARELSGLLARASRQQSTAVAGYDLTFTPVKSVSALWALAPRQVAQAIEQAHAQAVEQCLTWLEANAAYTRLGRGAVRQVETCGLIAAAFTHRDSRAGDPNLHTHVAVSNKVQVADTPAAGADAGRWLALDGRPLHKLTVAASERYNTRLEALLRDTLGVEFTERAGEPGKRAVREIVGVDARLLATWSARRVMIDVRRGELAGQFQVRHGRPPGPVEALKLAQQATLETRQAKHAPRSHADQRQVWRGDALRVLGTPQALGAMLGSVLHGVRARRHGHPDWQGRPAVRAVDTPGWVADTAEQVLASVQTSRATWQQAHVRAEAERAVRTANLPLARVDAAVERIVAAALSPACSLPLGVHEPVSEPAALRRSDGTSVYATVGAQLFTSPAVLAAEQVLLGLAGRTGGRVVSAEALELALLEVAARGTSLNPGQAAMVRELAGSGRLTQLALAPAGTGKTTAMAVLAAAWRGDGGHVIGLAPSAAAAAVLGHEIESSTDTLAKLIFSLDTLDQQAGRAPVDVMARGPVPEWVQRIGPGTLVILDEAGMAGTVELARAAAWLTDRGAVLRLVGDDAQLSAVGAGGVLRDIAETAGALTLSQVVRFTDPAEGAASLALRAGQRAAIGFYLDHDRVHVGDPTTGVDAAYTAWAADRSAGLDALMLAPTRVVTAELNARARTDRLAALRPTGTSSRTGPPADPEVRLSDGSAASAGDTVVTRRNNRGLAISATDWVKNGDRWTVREVLPGGALQVQHCGTGRVLTLPADYTRRHVALGYASTVHGAQGSTADTCHTVATGAEDRQLLYVAMTRGRTSNHLYLATAGDGDEHSVLTPDVLLPPTAVDLLTRIVDRDGAQVSATTAQRQLADPAVRLGAAADRYHDSLHVAALARLGQGGAAALDQAAEQVLPGLTDAPAWATLRASLALHAATDPSPDPSTNGDHQQPLRAATAAARVLHRALAHGEVGSAADPAAVLDWRLDLTNPNQPPANQQTPGPLEWLPAIPLGLETDQRWGIYLQARHGYTSYLAEQVADRARTWTPTSAPAWAAPLLGADGAGDLVADLAVWRAANHVDDNDLTLTGPQRLPAPDLREQQALDARVTRALGDPAATANRWRTLARQVEPRLLADPHWPAVADKLAAADRAGIDITALVTSLVRNPRHTDTAAVPEPEPGLAAPGHQARPLPDEMPAAALWWRLSRHLAPAALSAQAGDLGAASPAAPPVLRPAWTGHLDVLLGDDLAARVVADPAWPALVAAVSHASDRGWTAEQVLATAYGLLPSGTSHDPAGPGPGTGTGTNPASPRPSELATALVWRVAMLSDGPDDGPDDARADPSADPPDDGWAPTAGAGNNADPHASQQAPVDPHELELLPPEDLYEALDDSHFDGQDHQGADLADLLLPHVDASEVGEALPDQDEPWLASFADQEPPHHPDEDLDHDLDWDDVDDHDRVPSWLPSTADAAQTAGQGQLWQPPRRAGRAPDAATAAPTAADAAAATPAALVCRERLLEVNAQALAFYSSAYGGSWAQQHLQQRLGTDLVDDPRFTPGYAPAGWTHLVEHLRAGGATDPELLQAGLAARARTGRLIDRFRDRLILPIQTLGTTTTTTGRSRGAGTGAADAGEVGAAVPAVPVVHVIGFVGRRHPDAVDGPDGSSAGPKYLNTADNLVFSKGAQLYGLAEAARALAAGAAPVLVEGALDALAVTLATDGDAVGVAPLGTAFTDAQADMLRPYLQAAAAPDAGQQPPPACGVVVATDADAAGRKAADRAYWQLVARGGNPGHLALPDGLDPAELLTTAGPQALREAITAARSSDSTLARHLVTDRVASYADRLHTAEGTVHAIRSAANVIAALPIEQWPAHIAHLDTLVQAAPGITGLEVLDAALARTVHNKPDPVGTPAPNTSPTSTGPTRTGPTRTRSPGPQTSDEAPAPTGVSAQAGTAPATGPAAEPEVTSGCPMVTAAWAAGSWHDVAVAVDPRLVTDRYWPALAVALERAWRAGYDVQQHLPRLAGEQPLATDSPAYDLQYRVIRECPNAHTGISPKTQGNTDRRLAAEAAAAQNQNQPSIDEPRLDPHRQAPRPPRPGR
jgi:conjugative relaxase-like TrwC/TraI family protein